MFARMAKIFPALPLIGGGHTKFQPVFVGDVADAVMAALDHDDAKGRIFELGGPEVVTFRQIYERLFRYTGTTRPLVNLPFGIAKIQAFFMGVLPHPPLTPDQVESLKTDNVVSSEALTLADLGLTPTPMDLILPTYLGAYKPGGRFAGQKAA
jgi:NADH dehydrogenase